MWRETLKDYSVQEFEAAMRELVTNPPKYELEDGSIQVWRGMPKLPDVVNVMLDLREKKAAEYRRKESERFAKEMEDLHRRREAGEKFYGWADVVKAANQLPDAPGKPMPQAKTQWPDIDPEKNRAKLEQQREQLLSSSAQAEREGSKR